LPGQPESATLSESGRSYWQGVARIGIQVAEALAHAHGQGTLHRDIKPSNLLLDAQGTVWVTDFGLAQVSEGGSLTGTGEVVGTLRYIPPERFTGRSDARGDVYSLGLTLYELLTLRPAFGGDERHRLLERILHEEPPRPRQLDPVIPRDLETIVLKAIAKEPAHRYQTAAELADDLRRFLEDRPVKARRASAVERLWRWARRNPTVAALAIAVAGLLTLVTVVACVAAALLRQERNTILVQKEEIEQGKDRAEKAEAAERAAKEDALEKLRGSLLAQASAGRFSGRSGRRFDGLAALAEAARLRPGLDLRNEAIACLALADLREAASWDGYPPGSKGLVFDAQLERYARSDDKGNISVRRAADDRELARFPGDGKPVWFLRFSPDGRLLAARDEALAGRVWDLGGELVWKGRCGALDFSPDSRPPRRRARGSRCKFMSSWASWPNGRRQPRASKRPCSCCCAAAGFAPARGSGGPLPMITSGPSNSTRKSIAAGMSWRPYGFS